jgi:hypothetical protein
LLNSGRVELIDNTKLIGQFVALERRTSRAGRDLIDHPPGGHDDLANAVAGCLVLCQARRVLQGDIAKLAFLGKPLMGTTAPWQDAPQRDLRDYDFI